MSYKDKQYELEKENIKFIKRLENVMLSKPS